MLGRGLCVWGVFVNCTCAPLQPWQQLLYAGTPSGFMLSHPAIVHAAHCWLHTEGPLAMRILLIHCHGWLWASRCGHGHACRAFGVGQVFGSRW